jgi:hypothetical protein
MSNVIPFPNNDRLTPEQLLDDARESNLSGLVIMGYESGTNEDYIAVSNLTISDCIYLAELLKKRLMEDRD